MTCNGNKIDINDVAYLLMHRLHHSFPAQTLLGWIYGTGLPEGVIEEVLLGLLPKGCPQWASFYADLQRGLMLVPPEGVRGKAAAKLTLEQAATLLTTFWRQGLARYAEALALALPPATPLSGEGLALYGLFLWEYLNRGYLSSGRRFDAVYATLRLFWPTWDPALAALAELVDAVLLRSVSPYSYELLPSTRARLLAHFSLPDKAWASRASCLSREEIALEVAAVRGALAQEAEG